MRELRRPYTTREVAMIRDRYPTEGPAALAAELDRSVKAIRIKARQLGVRIARRQLHWTPEQDRLIKEYYPRIVRREEGVNFQVLASRIGRPDHQVRMRVAQLGLTIAMGVHSLWTEEQDEYLAQHAHLGPDALTRRFKARGWARSRYAIAVRLSKLGQSTQCTGNQYSARQLAECLRVSSSAVGGWIKRGWLKAKPRTEGSNTWGGPAEYAIRPADARQFIIHYTAHVDLSRANKHWLVDLLAGQYLEA